MKLPRSPKRLVQVAASFTVMYIAIQISIWLGVEKKTFFQKSWDIITGGTLGLFAGGAFFLLIGAIGLVSGPFSASIGLFGLMFGGVLGGMGLGTIVNILRNPSDYNIDYGRSAVIIVIGAVVAWQLNAWIDRRMNGQTPRDRE